MEVLILKALIIVFGVWPGRCSVHLTHQIRSDGSFWNPKPFD